MTLKVVSNDGDGPEGPSPADLARLRFAEQLAAMMKECLSENPAVAMLVWERRNGPAIELRSLVTPASQAIHRGLTDLLWEHHHEPDA
jgi:hypothetical protein